MTETKTARIKSVGGTYVLGVKIVHLSDGATLRIRTGDEITLDVGMAIAYDVDAHGNRFNPRIAANAIAAGTIRTLAELRSEETRQAGVPMGWERTGVRCENTIYPIEGSNLSARQCEGEVVRPGFRIAGRPNALACTHCDWTETITKAKA